MAILLHGTTRRRAEAIQAQGPDPDFLEPGGGTRAEGFSTCLESGPFPLGREMSSFTVTGDDHVLPWSVECARNICIRPSLWLIQAA